MTESARKLAEGEDGQGVTERAGIFGDLAGGVRRLHRQPIQKMNCIIGIGQRWQQRRYAADSGRRKFSEVNKFRSRTNGSRNWISSRRFSTTQHYRAIERLIGGR